jgi:hypothetical protein
MAEVSRVLASAAMSRPSLPRRKNSIVYQWQLHRSESWLTGEVNYFCFFKGADADLANRYQPSIDVV